MKRAVAFVAFAAAVLLAGASTASAQHYQESTAADSAPDAFYVSFGVGVMDNVTDGNKFNYQMAVGKLWAANRWLSAKITFEANTDFEDGVFANGLVGLNLYPAISVVMPYIGASMGIGYIGVTDEVAAAIGGREDLFGVDVNGVFGIQLLRGRPFGLGVEANTNILLRHIRGDEIPMTFGARALLLF